VEVFRLGMTRRVDLSLISDHPRTFLSGGDKCEVLVVLEPSKWDVHGVETVDWAVGGKWQHHMAEVSGLRD